LPPRSIEGLQQPQCTADEMSSFSQWTPSRPLADGACAQQPRFNELTLSAPVRGEFREILMTETRRSGFSVFYVCPPDVGAFPRRSQFGGGNGDYKETSQLKLRRRSTRQEDRVSEHFDAISSQWDELPLPSPTVATASPASTLLTR
jgi:hypothetical protein